MFNALPFMAPRTDVGAGKAARLSEWVWNAKQLAVPSHVISKGGGLMAPSAARSEANRTHVDVFPGTTMAEVLGLFRSSEGCGGLSWLDPALTDWLKAGSKLVFFPVKGITMSSYTNTRVFSVKVIWQRNLRCQHAPHHLLKVCISKNKSSRVSSEFRCTSTGE